MGRQVEGREEDVQLFPFGALADLLAFVGDHQVLHMEAGQLNGMVEHHGAPSLTKSENRL